MKLYYLIRVDGMPEGHERAALEDAFRAAINRQYGGEREAGHALFQHLDTANDSLTGLTWRRAYEIACDQVPPPPGATFLCELNWPAFMG